jgi:hypothetical protein
VTEFKIIYSAGNFVNSKIQLSRILDSLNHLSLNIEIAAFKKSSPPINIDWTLDSLLNPRDANNLNEDNTNFDIYYDQIKKFSPNLIISDLEYFTSKIGIELNIPVWQCSPLLITHSLNHKNKYNSGIFKNFGGLLNNDNLFSQRMINIIDNSSRNYIYSHYGDLINAPEIKNNFEWIRPYHKVGKRNRLCNHNLVSATISNSRDIIKLLNNNIDCVVFSDIKESSSNIEFKSIYSESEYYCNLFNSLLFVTDGQASFLADAFYNNKYTLLPNGIKDPACIINCIFSNYYSISKFINPLEKVDDSYGSKIISIYRPNIDFLHKKIEEMMD